MTARPRNPRVPCATCGLIRAVHPERGTNQCADCRWLSRRTNTQPGDEHALPPGRWVNHGLTKRFIPNPPTQKEPAA